MIVYDPPYGNRINRRLVMTQRKRFISLAMVLAAAVVATLTLVDWTRAQQGQTLEQIQAPTQRGDMTEQLQRSLPQFGGIFDAQLIQNVARMIEEGRRTFRYDTFSDEAF
jgi:hypothetical protein